MSRLIVPLAAIAIGLGAATAGAQTGSGATAVSLSSSPIVSRWQTDKQHTNLKLTVSAPAGTSGTVSVPELSRSSTIAEDGYVVWSGGAPAGGIAAREAGGRVVFSGVTGNHTFGETR